jgi:uncharacterized protein (TIGR02217 family)
MSFHDIRFPVAISRGSSGGPERRTDVVTLGSGHEERNSRWADSRRSWNAGYGIKTLADLHAVLAFFEERRGRLHAFRWRDPADWKSCHPDTAPSALDQVIGTGNGTTSVFQLSKTYGAAYAPWTRSIAKPVAGTVMVAVSGTVQAAAAFTVNPGTGQATFLAGHIPAAGAVVTAGFEFDCPVRFDTDKLDVNVLGLHHGTIPHIPLIEVRL